MRPPGVRSASSYDSPLQFSFLFSASDATTSRAMAVTFPFSFISPMIPQTQSLHASRCSKPFYVNTNLP